MPSLSEAFRAHPVHLHHSHLDFGSVKEVPDTHAWPPLDEHLSGDKFDVESVPVIDLGDPNVVSHIGHACETWGVFHITNHGISKQLLSDVESQGRHLFSLPTQQKLKAARHPDGVAGYGLVRISSFFSKLMWSEGFTIVGSPLEHARQLWPCDYIQFCNVMEEYEKEMKKLSGRLMLLILESLGLKKEDVKWAGPAGKFEDTCAAIQLNWYPACPDPTRAMGLAEHTDSPLITILHQSSTSGLQVFRERGQRWITVAPLSGSLVVNVGDLLHILSNARFHSVLHRAVVNRTQQRLSVAYLWGPPAHIEISPSPQLLTPDRPRLYRAVSLAEYLIIKAKHFNNALAFIRLNPLVN
ncbi:gibberellin 3-beta-dioxygenase 1-like protein [Cinnamomum micranthum f. kanehirae]|uniref:gibberellin 3beta-dioxygenase n=1 Tax=Cinnamomum micranthum f. kanehirae TaxID=337451 RepID=A0A443N419_9MAGN|nr:gibberellin 3-beta-dioxygenase 1-like protein [Cinnamomum micranthum f. kanehirae]